MLDEDEKFFKKNGVPLYSSHMIDLVCLSSFGTDLDGCGPMLTITVWYVMRIWECCWSTSVFETMLIWRR